MDFTRAADSQRPPRDTPPPVPLQYLPTQQRRIVEAIDAIERATGEPCAARQLARRLRLDESTVREYFLPLFRKGWLKTPNAPASLRRRI